MIQLFENNINITENKRLSHICWFLNYTLREFQTNFASLNQNVIVVQSFLMFVSVSCERSLMNR